MREFTIANQKEYLIMKIYNLNPYVARIQFIYGELVKGRYRNMDFDVIGDKIAEINAKGYAGEAFATIGRWRKNEGGDPEKPVFMPYIYIDIDRVDIVEAYRDTVQALKEMTYMNYDMNRVYVSLSGSKGFHVAIAVSQLGCPIFRDSHAARLFTRYYCREIISSSDPAVFSPRTIIRITGSRHLKTRRYKTTWNVKRFMGFDEAEILGNPYDNPTSVEFSDPTIGEKTVGGIHNLYESANLTRRALTKKHYAKEGVSVTIGPCIESLSGGVKEHDCWHIDHAGRNRAAFILACWLLESGRRQKAFTDRYVDVKIENDYGTSHAALEILKHWNDTNAPPFSLDALMKPYNSALKTVFK